MIFIPKSVPYEENHRINNGILEKKCNRCDSWLPCNDEYFYKNNNKIDGLFTYCKECNIKKSLIRQQENNKEIVNYKHLWHIRNRDKVRTKCKNWIKNNKEYAYENTSKWRKSEKGKQYYKNKGQQRKHKISDKQWINCKRYFSNTCAYCGFSLEKHKKLYNQDLHKEHIIDTGRNDIKNCVPSCKQCNSEKHQDSFNNWYNPSNPKYDKNKYHKIYMWIRYDCKKHTINN